MGLKINAEEKAAAIEAINTTLSMADFLYKLDEETLKTAIKDLIQEGDKDFSDAIQKLIKDAGDICLLVRSLKSMRSSLLTKVILESCSEKLKSVITTSGDLVGLGQHFPDQKSDLKRFAIQQNIWKSLIQSPEDETLLSREFPSIASNPYLKPGFSPENQQSQIEPPKTHIETPTTEIPHKSPSPTL